MSSYNLRSHTRGTNNSGDRSATFDFPGQYTPNPQRSSTLSIDAEGGPTPPPPGQPDRSPVEFPPINTRVSGLGEAQTIVLSSPTFESNLDDPGLYDSHSQLGHSRSHSEGNPSSNSYTPLSKEQANTIKIAQSSLTRPQREAIERRRKCVYEACAADDRRKGKQVDPREWGAVNIPANELNVNAQARELERLKEAQEATGAAASNKKLVHKSGNSANKPEDTRADAKRHRSATAPLSHNVENFIKGLPAGEKNRDRAARAHKDDKSRKAAKAVKVNHALLPSAHLDKKSYLVHALSMKPKTGSHNNKYDLSSSSSEDESSGDESSDSDKSSSESDKKSSGSDDDDSSSNSSSDPSTDSDSDTSSDSSSDSSDAGRRKGRSRGKRSKRSKKHGKRHRKSTLKPIAPEPYDGEPDPRRFHRFATMVTTYLEDGNVPRNRQALVVSQFLTGEADAFYQREVSFKNKKWDAHKLLIGLFNYCFPVDFRDQQRDKLRCCYQNDRSVKKYVSEIHEYFTTIGYTDKRERVNRLWHGFKPSIQKALWKDKLHPDTSKWSEVVRAAEINEIADSVMIGSDHWADRQHPQHPMEGDHPYQKDKRRHDKKRRDSPHGRKTNITPNFSSVQHEFHKWDNKQKEYKPKRKELSQEERDELRAANKCFNCRDTGHQAKHCPKKNSLPAPEQGSSSGPRMCNYNVEIDIEETERLRDLIEYEDTLNEFTLNAMFFEVDDDQSEHGSQHDSQISSPMDPDEGGDKRPFDDEFVNYREYMDPRDFLLYEDDPRYGPYIGDPWAAKAIAQLSHCRYYPGDGLYRPLRDPLEPRFNVFCNNNDGSMYTIYDKLHDSISCISKRRLKDNNFNLVNWYYNHCAYSHGLPERDPEFPAQTPHIEDPYAFRAEQVLASYRTRYPGELRSERRNYSDLMRFHVIPLTGEGHHDPETYTIIDHELRFKTNISKELLKLPKFNLILWYEKKLSSSFTELSSLLDQARDNDYGLIWLFDGVDPFDLFFQDIVRDAETSHFLQHHGSFDELQNYSLEMQLNGQSIPQGTYPAVQRNSSVVKDSKRLIPKPIVIAVTINGHPCRALVDTGSLGDFMSSTLAQQLKVHRVELANPIAVQLAVQGSRTKINYGAYAQIKYQDISEKRYFDITNISNYDVILGTPFLYSHQVSVGLNPTRVIVGSDEAVHMEGSGVTTLSSRSILIDPHKNTWRPSERPESLHPKWIRKCDALSRLYSNDAPGTERVQSTYHGALKDYLGVSMPILGGMEGANAVVNTHCARSVINPPETGLSETSREFATGLSGNFVLEGSRGQKEGGSKENSPMNQPPEEKGKPKDHDAIFERQVPLEGVGPLEAHESMKRRAFHTSKLHQTPHIRSSRPTPLQTSCATRSKHTPRPRVRPQPTRHSSSSTPHDHRHRRFQPPPASQAPQNSFNSSRHHTRASNQHHIPKLIPAITPPININLNITVNMPKDAQKKAGPRPFIHPRIKNVHYQFRSNLVVINDNGSKSVYHPYSVSMYQNFDKDVRTGHLPLTPGGYNNFAIKFNKVSGIAQQFVTLNNNNVYTSSAQPVRLEDLDFSMYPVKSGYRVPQLETAGISNADGTTDANKVKTSHKDDFRRNYHGRRKNDRHRHHHGTPFPKDLFNLDIPLDSSSSSSSPSYNQLSDNFHRFMKEYQASGSGSSSSAITLSDSSSADSSNSQPAGPVDEPMSAL